MDSNNTEPLLTRHALAPWLTELGYPISYSTLTKYCSPAINCGPPAEGYWGRQPIYRPSRALAWARERLRPATPASQQLNPIPNEKPERKAPAKVSNAVNKAGLPGPAHQRKEL